MLSILAGEWGGRKLLVPKSHSLRPSAGRVKASIFSILESYRLKQSLSANFIHCRVLDLFAGIGGLGIEALSRGASHAIFVEKDRRHADCLSKNLATLGAQERSNVLIQNVEQWRVWHDYGPYDLVFLDPPYAMKNLCDLLQEIRITDVLNPGAVLVFEHDPKEKIPVSNGLILHSERKLGPAGLSIFLCQR